MKISLLLIISALFSNTRVLAQDSETSEAPDSLSPWSFGAGFSAGVLFYDRQPTSRRSIPIETWGDFKKPFYTSYSRYQLSLAADYRFSPMFHVELTGGFSKFLANPRNEGGNAGGQNWVDFTDFSVTDVFLRPGLKLDLLAKKPDAALYLNTRLNVAFRNQVEDYGVLNAAGNEVNRFRSKRQGVLLNYCVGLEWEKFAGPHLGYSIGLQYFPLHRFRPASYSVEAYTVNAVEQSEKIGRYSYEKYQDQWLEGESIKQESFYLQEFYFNLSLRYRL